MLTLSLLEYLAKAPAHKLKVKDTADTNLYLDKNNEADKTGPPPPSN